LYLCEVKILASIWLVLYLTLTSGLNIALHFCMGSVADISILNEAKSCCEKNDHGQAENCSIEKPSCCEDVSVKINSAESQLKTSFEYSFEIIASSINSFAGIFSKEIFFFEETSNYINGPPLAYLGVDFTILFNCLKLDC